jgi:hypothetical protein
MPIDKVVNEAPVLDVVVTSEEETLPDIEIILEEDGSATVEIGEEDSQSVDFYANLADVIDPDVLNLISSELGQIFEADKSSRQDWEQMYAKGLDLLGLKIEERTKPFRGAAGAVHPMLTESIVQFQAQALKELMPSGGPVRSQVLGKETIDKAQQAARVQDFMNYQITTVMEEYTPEFDQALFYLGYGGSIFKKVYFDQQLDRMVSKLCLADDIYIPYTGSSVMSQCNRITHRIAMDANEFRKRVLAGEYVDYDTPAEDQDSNQSQIQKALDKVTGIQPTSEAEEIFLLEFHINLDVLGFEDLDADGEPTGIKLPYVVTMEETSGRIVGVRRNWNEDDSLKRRKEYFVHYVLIEGLGAYGLGFVHLIGGLSKAATSALRQLLDAGTLSNLPAGFKARGARIADDDNPIQPGEFRDIDAGGAELSASLMPLPYKEPSVRRCLRCLVSWWRLDGGSLVLLTCKWAMVTRWLRLEQRLRCWSAAQWSCLQSTNGCIMLKVSNSGCSHGGLANISRMSTLTRSQVQAARSRRRISTTWWRFCLWQTPTSFLRRSELRLPKRSCN